MNAYASRRTGAARTRARSANINGSTFGRHVRIHQGDLNIFKYWKPRASSPDENPSGAVQAQLEKKEKIDCRRSLSYRDIDARLQNISSVQPGTCEWFFETSQFSKWYDHTTHDDEFLWIKGNPGTGKSTLMKRVFEYCQTKGDYVIAAYFFNARGTELEKTPLGMLRSLLFQLLQHESSLYDHFLPIFRKKQLDYDLEDWEWREPELTSFFLSKLQKCQSRPLLLIIDALDECIDRDVQKVAKFLQHLSTSAIDAGNTLKICLSSRHYPFVRFKQYQELVLEKEKQHDEDIVKYISSQLTKKDKEIEEELRKKSSGIFMWVVLVITMLNSAYEDGKIEVMKQMLDKIPTKLEEVFAMLLDKDNPDKDETILILQWVLFAKRRLMPEEIYFAIVAGTNSQALGRWNPLQITPDIIRRRIISSSRGLVEICKSEDETSQDISRIEVRTQRIDLKKEAIGSSRTICKGVEGPLQYLYGARKGRKETVQFIHGSVNDFLLRNGRLQRLDPELIPDPVAKSHDRLKGCCMAYIMMESLELQNIEGVERGFPFLEYASRYLFDHTEEATSVGQAELLRTLNDNDVFKRVERFHNYFVDYGQDDAPLNLLQVLAALGFPKSVMVLLDNGADINAEGVPCGTALDAAMKFDSEETVKMLLNKGAKIDHPGRHFADRTTLLRALHRSNRGILAMLIEKGAKLSVLEKITSGSVLHQAVESGDTDIVGMVLDKGAKVNGRGFRGSALCAAAGKGHKDIVEMLLEKGAKVDIRGLQGSALCRAATGGYKEIVEMLLEKGANIHARGLQGSVVACAASSGNKEIVEMLLKNGADMNTRGALGSSLTFAAFWGKKEMVEMLLEKGAKVDAAGVFGSPLQLAAADGYKEIVEVLLNKGAKVNARGVLYSTALQRAAMKGHKEIVEMLLERGANINARGLIGLAYKLFDSSGIDETKNQEILVENSDVYGANIHVKNSGVDETKVQEMLLAKGIKMGTWGKVYGTALQAAAAKGYEEIVQLLLDRGAKR